MPNGFKNELTAKIADFLTEIGIEIGLARLSEPTFLPGILIDGGKILVDEEKLAYPGDLLHEAGHLAVVPGNLRANLSGEVDVPNLDTDAIESHPSLGHMPPSCISQSPRESSFTRAATASVPSV